MRAAPPKSSGAHALSEARCRSPRTSTATSPRSTAICAATRDAALPARPRELGAGTGTPVLVGHNVFSPNPTVGMARQRRLAGARLLRSRHRSVAHRDSELGRTGRRPDRHRGHRRRQRSATSAHAAPGSPEHGVPDRARIGGHRPRRRRRGGQHPHALRPRRLEHHARKRRVGADLPQRPVSAARRRLPPLRARRARGARNAAHRGRTGPAARRSAGVRGQRITHRRCRTTDPVVGRLPDQRFAAAAARARAHAGLLGAVAGCGSTDRVRRRSHAQPAATPPARRRVRLRRGRRRGRSSPAAAYSPRPHRRKRR